MAELIDELRQIRSFYFLGMYTNVIQEAQRLPAHLQAHGNLWSIRAQIEMDPLKMAHELPDAGSIEQRALKLYAIYRSGDASLKEQVVLQLTQLMQDPDIIANAFLQIYGTYIFIHENNYRDALQLSLLNVNTAEEQLEKLSLQALCLLALNRWDLADAHLKQLQAVDDDDVLGQLVQCYVLLARGDATAITEAHTAAQELHERVGGSAVVYTLLGSIALAGHKHKDAFQWLKQAREWSVQHLNTVRTDTLVDTMCAVYHRGGPTASTDDMLEKISAELAQFQPTATYFQEKADLEAMFDRYAAQFSQDAKPLPQGL